MQPIVALGCGLVGEYVIHRLADDGHQVVAVDIHLPQSLTQRPDVLSIEEDAEKYIDCLLYTSPSPRDLSTSRMPSSA